MIGDSDNVYAVIVSAETFELIDGDGNTVAEFGEVDPLFGSDAFGIQMEHLDPTVSDSQLFWTVSTPAETVEEVQAVGLRGPTSSAFASLPGYVLIMRDGVSIPPLAHKVAIQTGADAGWVSNVAAFGMTTTATSSTAHLGAS